jgi:hypothetical protein
MTARWQQVTGVAGIVFAILSFIGGIALAPQPPMSTDAAGSIVSFYANHRTGLLLQGYVFGISWLAFLIFLAGLHRALRASEQWATLVASAGVAWLALNVASQAAISTLAARVARDFPDHATVVALHTVVVMLFSFSFFALSALLIGAGAAGLASRTLGRWLCLFGYGLAGLALVTALSLVWPDAQGLYALLVIDYLLFLVWSVWASVVILRTHPLPAKSLSAPRALQGTPV